MSYLSTVVGKLSQNYASMAKVQPKFSQIQPQIESAKSYLLEHLTDSLSQGQQMIHNINNTFHNLKFDSLADKVNDYSGLIATAVVLGIAFTPVAFFIAYHYLIDKPSEKLLKELSDSGK